MFYHSTFFIENKLTFFFLSRKMHILPVQLEKGWMKFSPGISYQKILKWFQNVVLLCGQCFMLWFLFEWLVHSFSLVLFSVLISLLRFSSMLFRIIFKMCFSVVWVLNLFPCLTHLHVWVLYVVIDAFIKYALKFFISMYFPILNNS